MLHKYILSKNIPLRHANSNEDLKVLLPWWKGCFQIYECDNLKSINKALLEPIFKPKFHKCIITPVYLETDIDGDFVVDQRITNWKSEYEKYIIKINVNRKLNKI